MAASEVAPYAKTGGLADVVGSLPRALARRGHDCVIVAPFYRCARTGPIPVAPTQTVITVPVGGKLIRGRLWRSTLPNSTVPVYLVDQPDYFDRDDRLLGHGLYQFTATNGDRRDYPDNCARFVFFCRAVLEIVRALDWWPDVLHLHDWQTGLVPVYLAEVYQRHPDPGIAGKYARIKTLFTIHNIAYQGLFHPSEMELTGLDWRLFNYLQLEFHGRLNFLKAGLVFAQLLNTVSPTYAREIQTPYYGSGLQGVLSERRDRLFGIVNGIDVEEWDPATDPYLPAHYSADAVQPGKGLCKAAVQEELGLPRTDRVPLLGVVARLVEQKGINLIVAVAPGLLDQGCQLAVLGEGEPRWEAALHSLRERYPRQVGLTVGFSEALAHRIEAGADLFLMPSLFEPSGLNQLYSLRYGTVPVVRSTGGLKDTVVDCTPATLADGTASGFRFDVPSEGAFWEACQRALNTWRHDPATWARLVHNGMTQDWSWDRSAGEYEALYARLLG